MHPGTSRGAVAKDLFDISLATGVRDALQCLNPGRRSLLFGAIDIFVVRCSHRHYHRSLGDAFVLTVPELGR